MELKDVLDAGRISHDQRERAGQALVAAEEVWIEAKDLVAEVAAEKAEMLAAVAAEKAESLKGSAAEALAAAATERVDAFTNAAGPALATGRRVGRGLLVATAVAAAAGAACFVWRRRRSAVSAELSGEASWNSMDNGPDFQPGMADVQSPDVVDEEFAAEVDEAAAELAEEIVEAIDAPDAADEAVEEVVVDVAVAPEPEVPFEPGMADVDSPDVVDEVFGAEVDQAAEELAEGIVESAEEPGK